jgi:hypothetical protein
MRKKLFTTKNLIIILFILVIGYIVGADPIYNAIYQFKEYERYESPSGKYILIVYKASREPLHIGMTSSYWDRKCYVKLTNKEGDIVVRPFPIYSCTFSFGNLGVEWMENNNTIYFTKTEFIEIDKKRCYCE